MRRLVAVLIITMVLPTIPVSADATPFDFFIDDEVIIHPDETVQFRIAWHNIVGDERHFAIALNNSDSNLTIEGLPEDWTRVGSGRLGEMTINVTVLPNSNYETISFDLDITCQEVPDWHLMQSVDVIVSRWSNLQFGANDGSSFYVQQSVNTSLAVNITNSAGFDDFVKVKIDTDSNWQYGFTDDQNGDNEVHLDLNDGDEVFINFWIITPAIIDGAPLAGTGPTFSLEAESSLDKRVETWTFSMEMQTFHNMTVDAVGENLSLEPDDDGRLEVTIRNNGNIDTYLDASLRYGNLNEDRIEVDDWTVAIFNAFEFQSLAPNESRIIEIGFDAPNVNSGAFDVELVVMPQSFPQRATSVPISSEIDWQRSGTIFTQGENCNSVEWNETCQKMIQVENTGNFFERFSLEIVEDSGMNFEINSQPIGLAKGTTAQIPLNMTTIPGVDGLLPATAKVQLKLENGDIVDSISITSSTAPRVNWVWENAASSVNSNRLEVLITMRNDGNTADGLVVRMSSSYFTDMSFIPPSDAIVEDGSTNIRSFEVVNIEKGANFTFRAWAEIPDDQNSEDDFYLNITAHSRLAEENPFRYSANTSFDAVAKTGDDGASVVSSLADFVATFFSVIWAWKWIILATMVSALMINKSLRDRQARLEEAALLQPNTNAQERPEDWMAEFASKKQSVPEIAESPQIPSEVFTEMFQAVSGERKPSAQPVDTQLVGAASTVLDHHDTVAVKSKLDTLASEIAEGEVSAPHSANIALPDDIVPVTSRTVPLPQKQPEVPTMLDLDDLDL